MAFKMKGYNPFTKIDPQRKMAENRSKAMHRGKYADREKEMLLAAAKRKEENAAKKEAKGKTNAAARKREKAAKLREKAKKATGRTYEKRAVDSDMASYDIMSAHREKVRSRYKTPSTPLSKKDHDEKKYPTRPLKEGEGKVIGGGVPFTGGGKGKLITKAFNKGAKNASKQIKQIKDMLKKSGYTFKSSPKSKSRGNL